MPNKQLQKGVALITMMLVIFMVGTSLFFTAMSNRTALPAQQIEATKQLAIAKESLIAFAVNYSSYYSTEGPGRLPCPDVNDTKMPTTDDGTGNDDGNGIRVCNAPLYRYRLPEAMELPNDSIFNFNNYFSGSDYRFWYAISPAYIAKDDFTPLNSSTPGAFTLDNENDIVAVIIAPGEVLNSQSRSSDLDPSDYLESTNATDNSLLFTSGSAIDPEDFNDQVMGITRSDIMSTITFNITQIIKTPLDDYYAANNCNYLYEVYSDHIIGLLILYFGIDPDDYDYACYPSNDDYLAEIVPEITSSLPWFATDEWDDVANYNKVDSQNATLDFTGCNVIFSLNPNSDASRSSNKC